MVAKPVSAKPVSAKPFSGKPVAAGPSLVERAVTGTSAVVGRHRRTHDGDTALDDATADDATADDATADDATADGEVGAEAKTRLYRDGAHLAVSSLLAAVLGFVFWVTAARTMSPELLGVQTALLSIILGPAQVIAPGIGDALTALLPRQDRQRHLLGHAYRLVFVLVGPVALIAAAVSVTVFAPTRGSMLVAATVFAGVIIWALFTVQDAALTAMGRARWLPVENGLVGLAKLALLPLIGSLLLAAVWATLLPAAVAVAVLVPLIYRMSRQGSATPADPDEVIAAERIVRRELSWLSVKTTGAVAFSLGAIALLPFAVGAADGAAQSAVLALALSIAGVLDYVTAGIGMSLVVQVASHPQREFELIRAALARAGIVVCGGALVVALSAPLVLRAFGTRYLELGGVQVIQVLAVTSLVRVVYMIWTSVQQARRRLIPVLIANFAAAVAVYLTVILAPQDGGARTAAWALLVVQCLLSAGAAAHLWLRIRVRRARNQVGTGVTT